MAETPSKLDFFKVYDWLVCNIDTELRQPTLGAGEHMRLNLHSEPSDLTKGLILKYLIKATPGMPEYLPFRHPEQAPEVLEKCLRDKVGWLPFAAVSLGCMLLDASNKLREMEIPLYKFNDDDIYDVESLRLLQAEYSGTALSLYLEPQRKDILRQLVSKPEKERERMAELNFKFLERSKQMSLQDELQDIFEHAIIPDVRMNLDLAIALTDEKRKREKKLAAMRTWYEAAKMSHDDFERRVDGILEQFALSYFLETGFKTLVLPNGYRLSLREKADKLEIFDEEAAIAWAKGFTDEGLIKTKESIVIKALMKHIKETGEIPPGTNLKAGEGMSFSCKDKGGKGGDGEEN